MKAEQDSFSKRYGLIISVVVLLGIIAMPTPEGLTVAG